MSVRPATRNARPERASQSPSLPTRQEIIVALVVWAVATGAIIVVGGAVLPGPDEGLATAVTYLIVVAASFALAAALPFELSRGTGRPLDGASGLRLGATIATTGLVLDGLLMAIGGFAYPNVDDDQARTIAVALLLAWPAVIAGPWLAGVRAGARAGG